MINRLPLSRLRLSTLAFSSVAWLAISGCHSAFVQATVSNQTGKPIHLFEVDYPNASFGGGELAPGATFRYRFKILGDGAVKLTWTDAAEKEHSAQGPQLHEGQEGALHVNIGLAGPQWDAQLHQSNR